MPNWCSNNIVIEGPKEKVEAIWSRATDDTDEGLLTALHPIGKWEYETALAEWGTKWISILQIPTWKLAKMEPE